MATIKKITIKNFKSIKSAELSLSNLNVFVGPNGAGKTNLLNLFSLLRSFRKEKNINDTISRIGGTDKLLNYFAYKNNEKIEIDVDFLENSSQDLYNVYRFVLSQSSDANTSMPYFTFSTESFGVWDTNYPTPLWYDISSIMPARSILFDDTETLEHVSTQLKKGICYTHIVNCFDSIKYYHFHDTGFASILKRPSDITLRGDVLEDNGQNLALILYNLRKNHNSIYNQLILCIREIAPYFLDFQYTEFVDYNGKKYLSLQWTNRYLEGMLFNVKDFSDGTLRYIALLVCLMQPQENSIIILDEPELGLHPSAIKSLTKIIKGTAKRNQLVIATQSPLFLSEMDPQNLFIANYVKGETFFKKLSEDEFLYKVVKDMMKDENSLGDIWCSSLIGGEVKW